MADHPFQPDTRVAVDRSSRFSRERDWREDRVLKVYKNGNFVLASDPRQQWRPYKYQAADPEWLARRTDHAGGQCVVWSAASEAQIAVDIAKAARARRWRKVESAMYRLPYDRVTDEALVHFERGIVALAPAKELANG